MIIAQNVSGSAQYLFFQRAISLALQVQPLCTNVRFPLQHCVILSVMNIYARILSASGQTVYQMKYTNIADGIVDKILAFVFPADMMQHAMPKRVQHQLWQSFEVV